MLTVLGIGIPVVFLIYIIRHIILNNTSEPYQPREYKWCPGCDVGYSMAYTQCNTWGCPKPGLETKMSDPIPGK